MRDAKDSDPRSQGEKCAPSNGGDREQKRKKQVSGQMGGVETGPDGRCGNWANRIDHREGEASPRCGLRSKRRVHGTETRSRRKAQAKETKEMRRNDERRGGTGDYLWTGKAARGCAGTLCPMRGGAKPDTANT